MSSVFQAAFETATVDRYEALFRVSQTLISNRCPEELLKVLARELHEVVNFYYLGIGVYNEAKHEVHLKTFDESGAPIHPPKLAAEETMTWWVYQRQQPLVIRSVGEETRFPAAVEFLEKLGIRSMCTLPLTTVHRRLGALAVGSKDLDAYSEEEIRFLSLVANQLALAIDNALNSKASASAQDELRQKQGELQRERDRLQLLLEVTNQVVSNLELRDLLRAIAASIQRVMECDGAGVLLPDGEGRQLRVYALDFPESKGLISEEKLIPIENSVPGTAFQTGNPLVKNHSGAPRSVSENCGFFLNSQARMWHKNGHVEDLQAVPTGSRLSIAAQSEGLAAGEALGVFRKRGGGGVGPVGDLRRV